jgi:hypothetical protein
MLKTISIVNWKPINHYSHLEEATYKHYANISVIEKDPFIIGSPS